MDAKDGYFLAKRQMQEALDHRMAEYQDVLNKMEKTADNVDAQKIRRALIEELRELRNYVRNGMLWKNEDLESADS